MKPARDLSQTVSRHLADHPEAREALASLGVRCVLDPDFLATAGAFLKLSTLLSIEGVDQADFIRAVETNAAQARATGPAMLQPFDDWALGAGSTRIFLSLPCPLRAPVLRELETLLPATALRGQRARVFVDACGKHSLNDMAESLNEPEETPDLVVSAGLNSFFCQSFRSRMGSESLMRLAPGPAQLAHPALGVLAEPDPQGACLLYAANPLVILAVTSRLTTDPPRSWAELAAPGPAVGLCGSAESGGDFTLLTHLLLHHGESGLDHFGRRAAPDTHPSQMLRPAPGSRPPALGVMPLYFAQAVAGRADVDIIWPEEGALVSPLFLMAKESAWNRVAPVASLFMGPGIGRIASGASMPSMCPGLDPGLPPGPPDARLAWVGWDTLADRDVGLLCRRALEIFAGAWRGSRNLGAQS